MLARSSAACMECMCMLLLITSKFDLPRVGRGRAQPRDALAGTTVTQYATFSTASSSSTDSEPLRRLPDSIWRASRFGF